jgi:hypothetical protein
MSHKSHASHEDDPSIRLHASTSHWPMNRRGELQIGEAGARVSNESTVPGVSRGSNTKHEGNHGAQRMPVPPHPHNHRGTKQ